MKPAPTMPLLPIALSLGWAALLTSCSTGPRLAAKSPSTRGTGLTYGGFIYQFTSGSAAAISALAAGETHLLSEPLLASLRAEAARSHPTAAAGQQQAAAAARDVHAIRLWNDPMVGFGFMAAERMMRESDGDIILGIEQPLPKPGLFAAERSRAEAMQRAEVENSKTSGLAVAAEAGRAAIELALADESVILQQTQVEWLAAMVENARQRAADPQGSGTDALRMETELAKEQELLKAARRSREAYAQSLNLILGRPLESPWPALRLPPKPPPVPLAQAEIARIPYVNPQVLAMRELAGAATAETRMADRARLPDVSVVADTNLYSGGDFRSATLGMKLSLPWVNKAAYQAKIDAARIRESAADQNVEALRREIAARVLTSATAAANAAAQAQAYSGEIHAKALQAKQAIEAAWISSKAPLTELLDASRTLFSIQLEQRRLTAMELAALEELRTLVPNR